ncbi:MAG: hypothetical protein ACRDV3_00895 [Acidothermaceae bacterium]
MALVACGGRSAHHTWPGSIEVRLSDPPTAQQLIQAYGATWQYHRLRFSYVVADDSGNASDDGGATGMLDLADDAADFSVTGTGNPEIRLIKHTEYGKNTLVGLENVWIVVPSSRPDAAEQLPKILPVPEGLAKNLAPASAVVRQLGIVEVGDVRTSGYQWSAKPDAAKLPAGVSIPAGTTVTVEVDIDADHLVRRMELRVSAPTPPAGRTASNAGTATMTLTDIDAVPAITAPPNALTAAQVEQMN